MTESERRSKPLHERCEFVSEPLTPVAGTGDVRAMARGEPGLPARFVWRGAEHGVVAVERTCKGTAPEGGTGQVYLRRHWYTIRTDTGHRMTIYCERQARSRKRAKARWFVYTIDTAAEGDVDARP
jgi:hypothetical protein